MKNQKLQNEEVKQEVKNYTELVTFIEKSNHIREKYG